MAYKSAEPCAEDITNLSLLYQVGSDGLILIWLAYKVYIMGAAPRVIPGLPLLALSIISIPNILIVLIILVISSFIKSLFLL